MNQHFSYISYGVFPISILKGTKITAKWNPRRLPPRQCIMKLIHGRIQFSGETETGFSLVLTVLCISLPVCETKPVFATIETILGHSFAEGNTHPSSLPKKRNSRNPWNTRNPVTVSHEIHCLISEIQWSSDLLQNPPLYIAKTNYRKTSNIIRTFLP